MSDLPPSPLPPNTTTHAGAEGTPAAPDSAPKKKRHLLLKLVGLLIVLVILLILLAPTIASLGFVRSIVVGKVNENINGSISIGSYSVGWLGGISAHDVEVFDPQKNLILKLNELTTQMSLLDAIRGNYKLGDTIVDVDLTRAEIDQNGQLNYSKLAKTTTPTEPHKNEAPGPSAKTVNSPAKLPSVSGKLTVKYKGSVYEAGNDKAIVSIQPSTAVIDIPDINQPITDDVTLAYTAADGPVGTIKLSGNASAVKNNELDLDHIVADQKLELSALDLQALTALLKIVSPDTKLEPTGVASGSLAVKLSGMSDIAANGQINIASFTASGAPLAAGDKVDIATIAVPVDVTESTTDGKPTVNANVGVKLGDGKNAIAFGDIEVVAKGSQEAMLAAAKLVPAVAQHALAATQPTTETLALDGTGSVKVTIALDIAALANQVKNTIDLQKGIALNQGHLTHETDVELSKDTVKISTDTKLPDLAGTNDGKPVRLSPIDVMAGVTAVGGATPDMHALSVKFVSAFLNASGGGDSLSNEKLTGAFDLSKLQSEAEQFVDLNAMLNPPATQPSDDATTAPVVALAHVPVHFVGTGSFDLATDGTLIQQDGQGKVATSLTITGVDASGIGTLPPVKLDNLTANLNGDLHRSKTAIDFKNSTAALNAAGITVANAKDAANPVLQSETITANLAGDFSKPTGDGATTARLSTVTLSSSSALFSLKKTNADDFSVATEKGTIKGNGSIAVMADLKKLNDLAQRYSAASSPTAAPTATAGGAGDLQSGVLNGTLSLAHGTQPQTEINFDGIVSNLTVATAQKPISNESIELTAHAVSPDDQKLPLNASLNVDSRFATVNTTAVALLDGSIWDKLQKVDVDIKVPDIASLDSILNSFTAPATKVAVDRRIEIMLADADARGVLLALADDDTAVSGESAHDAAVRRKKEKAYKLEKEKKQQDDAAKTPAAADDSAATTAPLQITDGSADIKMSVSRDAPSQTTTLNVSNCTITSLAMQRGAQKYAFARPITLKLAAAVKGADDGTKKPLMQQIQQAQVTTLDGDLVVAKISMPQPLTVTNLSDAQNLDAKGTIKLDGSIGDAELLLAVYQNAKPMPYAGTYDFTQQLSTGTNDQGKTMKVTGDGSVTNFQVLDDAGKPAVTEPKVELKDDLDYLTIKADATHKTAVEEAIIRTLSINMSGSKALAASFTGRLINPSTKREFRGIGTEPTAKLDTTYDLAKLWPIIYPTLSPEMQTKYKTLKIVGQKHETFAVSGYYPMAGKSYESISHLNADGAIALDLLDLPQGLTIASFNWAFSMKNGVVQTLAGTNQPTTQLSGTTNPVAIKTALCNDGVVDLSDMTLNMGKPSPLLTIAKNHKLLQDVKLNPVLADTLGSANLIFKDATSANGLINMTIAQCNQVPLANFVATTNKANAQATYSITDLAIDGPVPSAVSSGLQLGGQGLHGTLQDGSLTLANGVATNSFTFNVIRYKKVKSNGKADNSDAGSDTPTDSSGNPLKAVNLPIKFHGGVELASEKLINFAMDITPALLAGVNKNAAQALPNGLTVPITGTVSKPKLDIGKALIENGGKNLLGDGLQSILGKKKKGDDSSSDDDSNNSGKSDPIGGLLDSLKKK